MAPKERENLSHMSPRNCSIHFGRLQAHMQLREDLAQIPVAVFGNGWGYWQSLFHRDDHKTIAKFITEHSSFKQRYIDMVKSVMPKHFAAVHCRLGDREAIPLFNCSAFGFGMGLDETWPMMTKNSICMRPVLKPKGKTSKEPSSASSQAFSFVQLKIALPLIRWPDRPVVLTSWE